MELIKVDKLTEVIQQNTGLTERAVAAIANKAKTLPAITADMSVEVGNTIDGEINDLVVRGNDAIKINKERRMVYTRKFDELKSKFTEQEKSIQAQIDSITGWRNGWNAEKIRRQREEQAKKEALLAQQEAIIQLQTDIINKGITELTNVIATDSKRMIDKFYSCTADELSAYVENLKGYDPKISLPEKLNVAVPTNGITEDAIAKTYDQVLSEKGLEWANTYRDTMIAERDKLVATLSDRLKELEAIAKDKKKAKEVEERLKAEEEARLKATEELAKQQAELAEQEANLAKMEAVVETIVVDEGNQVSKGTNVKRKYAPKDHKEMLLVIQWWITNTMPLMTIDEVSKKLSFMRTAADSALNKGEEITGVTTVEDVRTRASRK